MKTKTGYTANTKKHLTLGAGAIFKNFIVGTDTYESATSKLLGATQGGGEFKAALNYHSVQVDGVQGKVKSLDVVDSWDTSLTVSFIEVTVDTLTAALGASKVDNGTSNTYYVLSGDSEFKDEHYFDNITFIGTLSGSDTPIIVQIDNAINTSGLTIKLEDTKEGTIQVVFEGRYDGDDAPFKIYYPKDADATIEVASTATVRIGGSIVLPVSNVTGTLTAASSATSKATVAVTSDNYVVVTGVASGSATVTVSDSGSSTDTCVVTVVA